MFYLDPYDVCDDSYLVEQIHIFHKYVNYDSRISLVLGYVVL